MPTAPVHASIGSFCGVLIIAIGASFRAVRKNFKKILFFGPLFVSACGVFALLPDILTVIFPSRPKSFYHQDLANIAFFHTWLDKIRSDAPIEKSDPFSYVIMVAGYLLYVSFIFIYIIYIKKLESKGKS